MTHPGPDAAEGPDRAPAWAGPALAGLGGLLAVDALLRLLETVGGNADPASALWRANAAFASLSLMTPLLLAGIVLLTGLFTGAATPHRFRAAGLGLVAAGTLLFVVPGVLLLLVRETALLEVSEATRDTFGREVLVGLLRGVGGATLGIGAGLVLLRLAGPARIPAEG